MVSRICLMISLLAFAGCAEKGGTTRNDSNKIGDPLKTYMPIYMRGMDNNHTMLSYDQHVSRVHQFDLASLSLVNSLEVRKADSHNILTGQTGDYMIDIADGHIDLIRQGAPTKKDVLTFVGKPETAAFLPEEGFFAIVDEYKSIGLLKIDPAGEVLASWNGGSKFGESDIALAGDMLAGGRLVISLADKSLAVIDVAASIQNKAWSFVKTSPLAQTSNWISRISFERNWVLVGTDRSLVVYDLATGTSLAEEALDIDKIVGRFRQLDPHIFASDTGNTILYTVDKAGKLAKSRLPEAASSLSYSVLNMEDDILTVIAASDQSVDLFSPQTIYRLRLSDNLLLTKKSAKLRAKAGITPDYILFQYDSPLGYVERETYDQAAASEILQGFNLDFL